MKEFWNYETFAVGTSQSEGPKGTFSRRGRFLALAWHNFLALVLARSWRKILNSVSILFSNHSCINPLATLFLQSADYQ